MGGCCYLFVVLVFVDLLLLFGEALQFVERADQLSLKPPRRGKGKGRGRGRGDTSEKNKQVSKTDGSTCETKRRKIATPQNSSTDEGQVWTEEMCQEWAKWQWDETWYKEWGVEAEDWRMDLGESDRAWDRYAYLDGKHSLEKLGKTNKHEGGESMTEKSKGKETGSGEKELDKKGSKRKVKAIQEEEEEEQQAKEPEQAKNSEVPMKEKAQVAAIVRHLERLAGAGFKIKKFGDLTDADKTKLREGNTADEECRLNIYWKRPAVGVYLKGEKRDCGSFSVDAEHGPFLLRLGACLKAAFLWVT